MYHVIGTGIIIIFLYLISYFFYRGNLYSLQFHRRIWNSLLALAFLVTALAGLFLALQIIYKWDIPIIKTILKWHVEIGIGLAITGFIHFFWHSSYFIKFSREQEITEAPNIVEIPDSHADIPVLLFITGFISTSIQLLLLKEIMNIAGGYELVAGSFLCSWLIGSAAGSALAPRSTLSDIGKISLWFAVSPILSVSLMLLFSRLWLQPGETPSFLAGIVFTILVLLPFCLISGFTFIKLVTAGRASNMNPGRSFSIETAGGITAGIIISLLSTRILNTYQSLLLITILGIAYVLLVFFIVRKEFKIIFKSLVLLISILIIISSPDRLFRQLLLNGMNVIESFDTPYGNITRGKYLNDTSTYYNQRLLIYNNDAVESEEDIHYTMLQALHARDVMLISGPVTSRLNEICKYEVSKVVFVERDPALTTIGMPEKNETSDILQIKNYDAFSFIKRTDDRFDVVIMLLPPPSSLSLNRFYTYDFFLSVKGKMNPEGVFSCSPGINTNYINKESVRLYSSIFNSLKAVFKNVIPISGNKLYFIASDKELSTSICQLANERKIKNVYVSTDYLSDDLISSKSEEIVSLIDNNVKLNRSTLPVACYYYQSFNLSKNLNEKIPAIILLSVLVVLSLKSLKSDNGIMYFSALALAGYEIILLLMLQLTIGNMYQITGLIIAGLMTGLAVGTGSGLTILKGKPAGIKVLMLILFYFISGFAAERVMLLNGRFAIVILLIIAGFIPAVITGSFFHDLTSREKGNIDSSVVYSADLAGSAIGFLVFSGLAVPLVGISTSLYILPILVFVGFVFILTGKRS